MYIYVYIYIYIEEERDAVGQRKIHKEKSLSSSIYSGVGTDIVDSRELSGMGT